MNENHPPLWNMPVDRDDGLDPHCLNCGTPFAGHPTDKYCPDCVKARQWVADHATELEQEFNEAVEISDSDLEEDDL